MTPPASGTISKNGEYTGGLMMTRSPGRIASRSDSTMTTLMSVVVRTDDGSTVQPQEVAAKSANARCTRSSGPTYPVSDRRTAPISASAIGSASG